jgi:predicted nucleic acid-binding OB-fold protein
VIFGRIADTVDRRHRRHDHHVAPLQQALGGRQPHLLDVLVDRRVLLDEQVALRHVGFGLVVVVVLTKYSTALRGKNSRNSL